jgi:hypothetical protein
VDWAELSFLVLASKCGGSCVSLSRSREGGGCFIRPFAI